MRALEAGGFILCCPRGHRHLRHGYSAAIRRPVYSILPGAAAAGFVGLGLALAAGWEPPGDRRLAAFLYDTFDARAYSAELLLEWALPGALAVAAILIGWLLARGRRADAALVALALAGIAVIEIAGKALVRRPSINPADPDYSYPSGHAAIAGVIALLVLVFLEGRWRKALGAGAVLAAAVGCLLVVARGWHYPTDVVGGLLAAVAWVFALRSISLGEFSAAAPLGRSDRDRDRDAAR